MLIPKRLVLIIIFRKDPQFHEMAKDEMYQYIDAIRTEIAIVAGDEATAPENQNLRETLNTTHFLKQRLTQVASGIWTLRVMRVWNHSGRIHMYSTRIQLNAPRIQDSSYTANFSRAP